MSRVTVAVLNWNGRSLLEQYMPDVVAHSAPYDVVVIDNNSEDTSIAYLEEHFPGVRIIQTGDNHGYAGGYNVGLKEIDTEFTILLNSDVRTTPGWLEPIVAHFDNHTNCAALQPKIRWERAPEKFEYAGAAGGFIDALAYPFCRGRVFWELEEDHGQYNDPTEIFWATGACLAVRTSLFKSLGGLDPMLFAHMEEIDFCWRAQRAGYTIWAVPQSTVYHLGGATLQVDNPQKTFLNFRNNLHMITKNLPHYQAMPLVFVRLCLDGVAGIQFLFQGKWRHTLAVIRAHFAFYGRFSRIQRSRTATAKYPFLPMGKLHGVHKGSVVWAFYALRKRAFSSIVKH